MRLVASVFTLFSLIVFALACSSAEAKNALLADRLDAPLGAMKDWTISHPSPDSALLVSRVRKQTLLIREYRSSLNVADAETYLIDHYRNEVIPARQKRLAARGFDFKNAKAVSEVQKGLRFGQVNFELNSADGAILFAERTWPRKDRLWQITLADYGTTFPSSVDHETTLSTIMNLIMDATSDSSSHASWIHFVLPTANAAELLQSSNSPSANSVASTTLPEGNQISCEKRDIPTEIRADGAPSLKVNGTSVQGCITGAGDAFPKMIESTKKAFVSSLEDLTDKTEANLERHPCPEPPKPSGISGWLVYSAEIEAYNNCLESAGTTALIQKAGDIVSQTGSSAAALAKWVWTTQNPVAVISEILRNRITDYECLKADIQAKMFCEFVTKAAISTTVAVASGGASAAAAAALSGAKGVAILEEGLQGAKAVLLPFSKQNRLKTAPVVATTEKKVKLADRPSIIELQRLLSAEQTSHALIIKNGKAKLKIGFLYAEQQQISRAIRDAIVAGDLTEIDGGQIIGPKVLRLLISLNKIAPNGNLKITGSLNPSRMVKKIKELESEPATYGGRRNSHHYSEKDKQAFTDSVDKLGLAKACQTIYRAKLEDCGPLTFTMMAKDPIQCDWTKPRRW